jgi:hypothetical protein
LNALIDTNVLVRAADPVDPAHRTAIEGLIRLRRAGTALWARRRTSSNSGTSLLGGVEQLARLADRGGIGRAPPH